MAAPLLGSEYVTWVQRSLNRIWNAGLNPNGMITPDYRREVSEFQAALVPQYANAPAELLGKVDEVTQNTLIEFNHTKDRYISWVQQALNKLGKQLPLSGALDGATLKAIKSFQSGNGLKSDGWVGPKTETELVRQSKLLPPGSEFSPVPVPLPGPAPWHGGYKNSQFIFRMFVDRLVNDLKTSPEYPFSTVDPSFRACYSCVMHKITRSGESTLKHYLVPDKIDAWLRNVKTVDLAGLKPFLNNANREVEMIYRFAYDNPKFKSKNEAYNYFATQMLEIAKAIDKGRDHLNNKTATLGDAHTRFLTKWWQANENDPRSVYNCFATLLDKPAWWTHLIPIPDFPTH